MLKLFINDKVHTPLPFNTIQELEDCLFSNISMNEEVKEIKKRFNNIIKSETIKNKISTPIVEIDMFLDSGYIGITKDALIDTQIKYGLNK